MLFSSITFLYYFLPWAVLVYFAVPRTWKNGVLLLSSLFFYAWGEPRYLVFLLFSITQGYVLGIQIEKYRGRKPAKFYLAASVFLSLLLLGYCKYADFFISSVNLFTGLSLPLLRVALPVGISFYTFQLLSYLIDVYRGRVSAQKSYLCLATYIAMFPQLIAGPIVRYEDIAPQLADRTHSISDAAAGIRRFVLGLSKKILVANVLGELVAAFKASDEKSVLFFWLYAAAYMLHVYFDFSGYSDMAIGLGRIFGFHFSENFHYPYIAGSITEFWRRWHISLGTWFRDYLYIPLGGNRVTARRWLLNLFLVWMATGLWHGASWTYAVWGLLFAMLLVMEKQFFALRLIIEKRPLIGRSHAAQKARAGFRHIYVLFVLAITFVIFDAETLREAFFAVTAMFGRQGFPAVTAETLYCLQSYLVLLLLAAVGATPLPKIWFAAAEHKLFAAAEHHRYARVAAGMAEPMGLLLLLVLCTAFLIDGSFNPFLYFRF